MYRVEDIDDMDAGLSELQTMLEAGERRDMLLQQDLLRDAADGEPFLPAEIKVDDVTAASETVEMVKKLVADAAEPVVKPSELTVEMDASTCVMRRLMKYTVRLLKYAVPLPLLLVVVFGGLFLLCDGWHEMLNDLGLLINPQLKHVRGAPPV